MESISWMSPVSRLKAFMGAVIAAVIFAFAGASVSATPSQAAWSHITTWGAAGTLEGQFSKPWGMATDASGNVYVADYLNRRIQKFDSNGIFIRTWGRDVGGAGIHNCTSNCQAGSTGTAERYFNRPLSMAVDTAGYVYVGEDTNRRVQKFDSNGNFVRMWGADVGGVGVNICTSGCQAGAIGSGEEEFKMITGLAVDSSGNVYVADAFLDRVQMFNSNGGFLRMWGWGVADGSSKLQICSAGCQAGIQGSGDGQFTGFLGVSVDSNGVIYVSDTMGAGVDVRVQKFPSIGVYQGTWGINGTADSLYRYDVAADAFGNVYVADTLNNRVRKFDSNGTSLSMWGSYGINNGQFDTPAGITTDALGNVYTSEIFNNRIQKFGNVADPTPTPTPDTPTPTTPISQLPASAFKEACNMKITSPKVRKAKKGNKVKIKVSRKAARRMYTHGAKGRIDWGRVVYTNSKGDVVRQDVDCKKIKMVLLQKRGKRYYVPGTKIRISKSRLKIKNFSKKTISYLKKKKVGKLRSKRVSSKRRTKYSFKDFNRKSRLGRRALNKLRKHYKYRGTFVFVYTAKIEGRTIKKEVTLQTKKKKKSKKRSK